MKAEAPIRLLLPDVPPLDEILPRLRQMEQSGQYSNFGPLCRELEARLGDKEAPAVTVANATAGMELTLQALGLPPASPVLLPALTFPATGTAVLRCGHRPVFADADPESWTLTPEIARRACAGRKIAAVLPVAVFGCPLDADAWDCFSAETGIPVIIDAAGAFGSQSVGQRGAVVFSLHATKALAAGEGGFVRSRDPELLEKVRQLSNFGFADSRSATPGTNAKLSEWHAAAALTALDRWPQRAWRRLRLACRYRDHLAGHAPTIGLQSSGQPWARSVFAVRVPNRDGVEQAMAGADIDTRRWYLPPLHEHPSFAGCEKADTLAVTETIGRELVGLPFHLRLTPADVRRVCDTLTAALL